MIQVDHRTAALLFYALQTASSNLSRTTFEPRPQQVVIDPSSIPDTSLGDDAWYKEEFQSEEAETDRDDETSDTIHATVDIQAMADCVGESVGTGLRPVLTGQRPVTTRTDSPNVLDRRLRRCSRRIRHGQEGIRAAEAMPFPKSVPWLTADAPRLQLAIHGAVFREGHSTNRV